MEQPEAPTPYVDPTDPTPGTCDNCGAPLFGEFCHVCGQHEKSYIRNAWGIVAEFLREFGNWDSRVMRTLVPLFFRPGYLSTEYIAGRRVRYVPPIRLYLFVSLVFFLVVAFTAKVDTTPWREQMRVAESAAEVQVPPLECRPRSGIQIRGDRRRPVAERVCVSVPGLSDEANQALHRQVVRSLENPDLLMQQARQLAAPMMFLLLPVFAFILKVLYLFAGRYYTEHLTLALHTHSFLFVAFLMLLGLGRAPWDWTGLVATAVTVWIPVYLFLAQKRFYRQGWLFTGIKYLATGTVYFFMVLFGVIGLLILSIITA